MLPFEMKFESVLKTEWKIFICFLLITWFLGLGFCMPPNPDGEKNFQNSVENSSTLEMYSMPSQGKTYVQNLEIDNIKLDEQPSHLNQDINQKIISFHSVNGNANSSTGWILPDGYKEDFDSDVSEILLQNNDIDAAGVPNSFFVGDLLIVKGKEVLLKDDDSTPEESVVHIRHRTSSSMNGAEVPFIDEDSRKLGNRNLSRKRRQRPDTRQGHRRHRKRKRRHRLVLKPRENNRNYLTDSKEDLQRAASAIAQFGQSGLRNQQRKRSEKGLVPHYPFETESVGNALPLQEHHEQFLLRSVQFFFHPSCGKDRE
ncbi:uncharacterized protein LOC118204246 [Stegodyphus dumicola]|uniref:uncharacterized protein LOC118204246 n=1 Tax=Stegodyphus dumicola TaxID=202533 RepID=UPI0015B17210|nr:uncharacterized protein LOC118204246 [Stegodyphus dumicola]